jgi:hypothetical protein
MPDVNSQKPEILEYAHISAPYTFTALDYVTATVNAIVVFFLAWCGTSVVRMIFMGNRPWGNALSESVGIVGLLGLPLAMAVLDFRHVLRQRKRRAVRKRAGKLMDA